MTSRSSLQAEVSGEPVLVCILKGPSTVCQVNRASLPVAAGMLSYAVPPKSFAFFVVLALPAGFLINQSDLLHNHSASQ